MNVLRINNTGISKDSIEPQNMAECLITIKHINKLENLKAKYDREKLKKNLCYPTIVEMIIKSLAINECIELLREGK